MCKVHKSSQIFVASDKPVLINWTVNKITEEYDDFEEEKEQQLVEEDERKARIIYEEAHIENIKQESKKILDEANDEAKRIMKEAEQNVDFILRKAQDDGCQKGFEEGKILAEKKYKNLIKEAESVLVEAKKERKRIIESIESEIIELISDATYKITKQKIENDDEIFIKIVKNALEKFKLDSKVNIRISASDYEEVNKREDYFKKSNDVKDIKIIKDSSMKRGDCVISAESGEIDAGIETQVSYIKEGLKQIV